MLAIRRRAPPELWPGEAEGGPLRRARLPARRRGRDRGGDPGAVSHIGRDSRRSRRRADADRRRARRPDPRVSTHRGGLGDSQHSAPGARREPPPSPRRRATPPEAPRQDDAAPAAPARTPLFSGHGGEIAHGFFYKNEAPAEEGVAPRQARSRARSCASSPRTTRPPAPRPTRTREASSGTRSNAGRSAGLDGPVLLDWFYLTDRFAHRSGLATDSERISVFATPGLHRRILRARAGGPADRPAPPGDDRPPRARVA